MTRAVWHCALAAALVVSTSAVAQAPRSATPSSATPSSFPGAQGQKQDQPVKIDAKNLEVQDKKKTATFTGNVKVVQGDTTMTCRTLEVLYGQELGIGATDTPVVKTNSTTGVVPNAQNIRLIRALGNVLVVTKEQNATGDIGIYDLAAKTITLTGNVVLSQGKNVIHGDKLIVDTATGNAHVEGATQTGVHAVIVPNKNQHGADSNVMTIGPGQTAPGSPPR
jgi:lipopolysaccharide export system protein LptA